MPSYTSSGVHDGFGDGTLLWGSTGTPNLAVSIEQSFSESTITVTDLVGQSIVGASVTSHGFFETTDGSGLATLPLLSSGSLVAAEDSLAAWAPVLRLHHPVVICKLPWSLEAATGPSLQVSMHV